MKFKGTTVLRRGIASWRTKYVRLTKTLKGKIAATKSGGRINSVGEEKKDPEIEHLKDVICDLQIENDGLNVRHETFTIRNYKLKNNVMKLEAECREHNATIERRNGDLTTMELTRKLHAGNADTLKKANQDLKDQIERLKGDKWDPNTELDLMAVQCRDLEKKVADLKVQKYLLEKRLHSIEKDWHELALSTRK